MCGGVPFLANPQSIAYSLPQLLLLSFEPVRAVLATLLASGVVGGAASFALARHVFRTSVAASTLCGLLFAMNGFVFYRVVIGHLPYHAFALAPVLAYAVISSHRAATGSSTSALTAVLVRVVAAGVVVAYLTYAGALNFQIPVVMTVLIVLLMFESQHGFDWRPWLVLGGGLVWGALLSAAKLVPATVFVAAFPRTVIPLYLFRDTGTLVLSLLTGLFLPARLPDHVIFAPQAVLGRHEFEFGVSVVPLYVCVLGLLTSSRDRARITRLRPLLMIAILLAVPIVLCRGDDWWGDLLLQVPILNNNTTFVRWWAVYLLPLCVATALGFDRIARSSSARVWALAACVSVVLIQQQLHQPGYYRDERTRFEPSSNIAAYLHVRAGGQLPTIREIGPSRSAVLTDGPGAIRLNDAYVEGRSALPCYEPIFGYDGELAPALGLINGPVATTTGDHNLVDPATYLLTSPVQQRSWRFDASRLGDAQRFAAYQPLSWTRPWWIRVANLLTMASLLASIVAGLRWLAGRRRGVARPH